MRTTGPIYEVTFSIDEDLVEAFDDWLADHVAEMLELPGFADGEVYEIEGEHGIARRACQYFLDSDADLDQYLAESAATMRQEGIDRFGDNMQTSRRILRSTDWAEDRKTSPSPCLNCGTLLGGQYCANCGQRAKGRLISVVELIRDAFGDLFELDSRLWRTLIPLLTRPGQLTRDYLEGRRASYMPPFRTYLVLSILFFFASFFNPEDNFGILFEPTTETGELTPDDGEEDASVDDAISEVQEEVLAGLAEEGIITNDKTGDSNEDSGSLNITFDDDSADCTFENFDSSDMPPWLARRLTKERLEQTCSEVRADNGREFLDKLKDNGPIALIILLPLMALVQKALYPLSKRYYVEHLLFFVHYHAFFFLVLTVQLSFAAIVEFAGLPSAIANATATATTVYIPVYLYKAMRRVYGQRHFVTLTKFIALTLAYFFGLTSIFVVTAVFSAFAVAG